MKEGIVKYTDTMIDLETLDVVPSALILTIGAVAFNRDTGEMDEGVHISVELDQPGRTISPSTVQWWMKQSKEAQERAFDGERTVIGGALHALDVYIYGMLAKKGRVWANAPTFDLAILRNAYGSLGSAPAWHYRQERCFRTYMEGFEGKMPPNTLAHDALADAIWQARAVMAAAAARNANATPLPL